MVIIVTLLSLVGLFVFVRWDRKRIARDPAKGLAIITHATSQGRTLSQFCAGLGLVTAALAYLSWTNPSTSGNGRRLRLISQLLVEALGPAGPAWALTMGAVALLWMAFGIWRATPKRPTDRWLL